jgi:hypothetical protein
MSQHIDFLDNPIPGRKPGDLGEDEKWWVERQEALERAGYLLRSRYRPGWKPSWAADTKKFYFDFEDGKYIRVSDIPFFPPFAYTYDISTRIIWTRLASLMEDKSC